MLRPVIKVNLKEAEGHLGHLIEEAAAGREVVIAGAGGSTVRLVPLHEEEEESGAPAAPKSRSVSERQTKRKIDIHGNSLLRAAVETHPAFGAEISTLELLDDPALWNAAQTKMPPSDSERMEELHRQQRVSGLSGSEAQELARLEQQYERVILVRSHSASLLEQRGHDIRKLTSSEESRRLAPGE
jgi:antitoxin (DNA-binding transcriptional repressor) of toxin-antitoxin stability system